MVKMIPLIRPDFGEEEAEAQPVEGRTGGQDRGPRHPPGLHGVRGGQADPAAAGCAAKAGLASRTNTLFSI